MEAFSDISMNTNSYYSFDLLYICDFKIIFFYVQEDHLIVNLFARDQENKAPAVQAQEKRM